jgi:hypothetical protein
MKSVCLEKPDGPDMMPRVLHRGTEAQQAITSLTARLTAMIPIEKISPGYEDRDPPVRRL